MRARVTPGSTVAGEVQVPGDKSIAHRWLLMAATADGREPARGPASIPRRRLNRRVPLAARVDGST